MNVEEKVKDILFELSGEEATNNSLTLQGDFALDSLLMVTLLVRIEEEFSVELDETDMNPYDLITVQDVVCMVEKYCDGDECE